MCSTQVISQTLTISELTQVSYGRHLFFDYLIINTIKEQYCKILFISKNILKCNLFLTLVFSVT